MRVGIGFDARPLIESNSLVICGVSVPSEKGFEHNSDLDVLSYAIADALLGAAGLGDTADHLQDIKKKNDNLDSIFFLREVEKILNFEKFKIANIDISLVLPNSEISQHKSQIQQNIANNLFLKLNQVNVKVSDSLKPGIIGKENYILCYAIVLLLYK